MQKLRVNVKDKLSIPKASILGLQHLLAMGFYMVPMILASILNLDISNRTLMLQMTFISVGIGTLLHNFKGTKLPIMQGPSFVPIGALATIGLNQGLPAMFGSLIPGAILVSLLGKPLKLIGKFIKKFVKPIIAGTVTTVIGLSLIPSSLSEIANYQGNMNKNFIVAIISASLLILLTTLGDKIKNPKFRFISTSSVVISLVVGTVISSFFGLVDMTPFHEAKIFSLPRILPFGSLEFKIGPILSMMIIYLIMIIETTGTWFAVGSVTDQKLDESDYNNGAFVDGIGSTISALLGSTPLSGYSSNAGVIAITGVGSRYATIAAGVLSILIGLFPKIMSLLLIIPAPVLFGIFLVVVVTIFMNGVKLLQGIELNNRNMMVIGIPIIMSLLPALLPQEFTTQLPEILQYFVSSGIAMGGIVAIVLNSILPE